MSITNERLRELARTADLDPFEVRALIAEVLALREQRGKVLAIHRPYRVYDECECTDEQLDDGRHREVEGVGLTCNFVHHICSECCCSDDYMTEECASSHEHGLDIPICPTARALGVTEEADRV